MYYTYIVRCADSSLYTGITTSLERRMSEHAGGTGAKYTASHPVTAVCAAWSSENRADASRLEYRIKALDKRQKERLAAGEATVEELLPLLEGIYCPVDVSGIEIKQT